MKLVPHCQALEAARRERSLGSRKASPLLPCPAQSHSHNTIPKACMVLNGTRSNVSKSGVGYQVRGGGGFPAFS